MRHERLPSQPFQLELRFDLQGFPQAPVVFVAVNFNDPELFQVGRPILHIQQCKSIAPQPFHQIVKGNFRHPAASVKLRFRKKCAPQMDTVGAPRQLAVLPNFHGMSVPPVKKLRVNLLHLRRYPRILPRPRPAPVCTCLQHGRERFIEGNAKITFPNLAQERARCVKMFERQNSAVLRQMPADHWRIRISHGKNSLGVA